MSYQFQAKHAFATYPRCEIQPSQLFEEIDRMHGVKYALIAVERHQDGTPHLHALFQFNAKLRTRNPGFLDVLGYHPNVQVPRNLAATSSYIKKDGSWEEFGSRTKSEESEDYFQVCRNSNKEDWITYCIQHKIPHAYMREVWSMCNQVNTITEWDMKGEIDIRLLCYEWKDLYFGKAIVLKGPTGIGKTSWAKKEAPKPCLMINHMDALKEFKPEYHKSIIFDDMSFMHLPREAQIMIVDSQNPRQIHVRYGIVNIPAGIPKIFTCNTEIFTDDPAINRRYNKHIWA